MSNKDDSGDKHENIFEILDGMMFQLSRTKKMFMIMILTVLIIPPLAILVTTTVFDSPFQDRFEQRLQEKLQIGEITPEEYQKIKDKPQNPGKLFLKPPQLVIFAISLIWLGIGIRQWIVLSRWDKRYKRFKKQQEDIDKKLDEDPKEDE